MSYISIEFGVVFLLFFALYWCAAVSPRVQNLLLLVASYGLVASFSPNFAALLLAYTLVIYLFSLGIYYSRHPRFFLGLAIVASIAYLFVFKYLDFFRENFQDMLRFAGLDSLLPAVEILMPIGISYYIFHAITYLVSLYRQRIILPRWDDFALFLAFFPTLVAGPINRAETMLPQIQSDDRRQIGDLQRIFVLIILAVAKKLWLSAYLADNWVQPILSDAGAYHSLDIVCGLYAYALQIFLDFSGYTDLMIALALLLGFQIPDNFNMPYAAVNIRDFWRRWHISLSTWIRDYIYFPLGGSRGVGFARVQFNVMVAMVLSGLWHGAGLNFLVWGALHGVAIVGLNITDRLFGKTRITAVSSYIARWLTFHFICFTWIFFYAPTLSDGLHILDSLVTNYQAGAISVQTWVFIIAIPLLLLIYPFADRALSLLIAVVKKIPLLLAPPILTAVLLLIVLLAPEGIPAFIYASF